eukprot:jgi/Mesen1/373/ME000010S_10836
MAPSRTQSMPSHTGQEGDPIALESHSPRRARAGGEGLPPSPSPFSKLAGGGQPGQGARPASSLQGDHQMLPQQLRSTRSLDIPRRASLGGSDSQGGAADAPHLYPGSPASAAGTEQPHLQQSQLSQQQQQQHASKHPPGMSHLGGGFSAQKPPLNGAGTFDQLLAMQSHSQWGSAGGLVVDPTKGGLALRSLAQAQASNLAHMQALSMSSPCSTPPGGASASGPLPPSLSLSCPSGLLPNSPRQNPPPPLPHSPSSQGGGLGRSGSLSPSTEVVQRLGSFGSAGFTGRRSPYPGSSPKAMLGPQGGGGQLSPQDSSTSGGAAALPAPTPLQNHSHLHLLSGSAQNLARASSAPPLGNIQLKVGEFGEAEYSGQVSLHGGQGSPSSACGAHSPLGGASAASSPDGERRAIPTGLPRIRTKLSRTSSCPPLGDQQENSEQTTTDSDGEGSVGPGEGLSSGQEDFGQRKLFVRGGSRMYKKRKHGAPSLQKEAEGDENEEEVDNDDDDLLFDDVVVKESGRAGGGRGGARGHGANGGSKPEVPPRPEPPKDYIHVRARRGQATDSHSLAERVRREKISERMKVLQDLVPTCTKVTGKALMLDEIINYVRSLQLQVELLSSKLSTIGQENDCDMDEDFPKLAQLEMAANGGDAYLGRLNPGSSPCNASPQGARPRAPPSPSNPPTPQQQQGQGQGQGSSPKAPRCSQQSQMSLQQQIQRTSHHHHPQHQQQQQHQQHHHQQQQQQQAPGLAKGGDLTDLQSGACMEVGGGALGLDGHDSQPLFDSRGVLEGIDLDGFNPAEATPESASPLS